MSIEPMFSGGVFSDAIEGGRAGARIELTRDAIVAQTPDGDTFSIRYGDCQVEMGGHTGRMIFCRTSDRKLTIFCEDKPFLLSLSNASLGLLAPQLESQLQRQRAASRRGRWLGILITLAIILLVVGGYYAVRLGVRLAVHALPLSVDRQIGVTAYNSMDLGGPENHDPELRKAMKSIVDRLSPHAAVDGFRFEIHVIESPMINAFALPGGTIVVYTGLIEEVTNAEQLAGVLAHEMAHVTYRHGLERIGQSLGVAASVNLLLGHTQGLMAAGAQIFQFASMNSYSRGQESDADAEGVRMLHAAQIDPSSLSQFFELLKKEETKLEEVVHWIGTHPDHDARIAHVEKLKSALAPTEYRPLDIAWNEVQQIVAP